MSTLNVAVVSRDPATRAAIAERFDDAPSTWKVALFEDRPARADVVVSGPDVSVEADVVFDPERPGELLDQVRAVCSDTAKIFVVTGAGRGTGVTSAALHLARSLAAFHETCYVDLDAGWTGAKERLGLGGRATMTWADAGSTAEELRLAAIPVAAGFRVLLASQDEALPDGLIDRVAAAFPRVVVDLPADDASDLGRATATLLLIPPTPSGIARARSLLTRPVARRFLIVSRTGHGGAATRVEIEERLGHKTHMELPCTPSLRDVEDGGRLLVGPWTRYNRRIARLAAGLDAL